MRAPLKTTMVSWTPSLNIVYFFFFSDDHNRVLLKETASATGSDYINASYIVSDETPNFLVSFIHLLHSYNKVIQNIETCKEFWIHTSNLVCGEGGKVGHLWFKRRSTKYSPATFFRDCRGGDHTHYPSLASRLWPQKASFESKATLALVSSTRSSMSFYKNLSWCDTPFHVWNIAVSSRLWQWMACFVLLCCILTLDVTLPRWTMIPRILLTLQHRDP